MPKYYCLLCETSHPETKPAITCSSCGRIFCEESIQQSFSVGVTGCPYCDQPLDGTRTKTSISGFRKEKKPNKSFNVFERITKGSKQENKNNLPLYIFIGCVTLPFVAIIGLMFLIVFSMFIEIFLQFFS